MTEGALKLRRATVIEARDPRGAEQEVLVQSEDGVARPAIADVSLLGTSQKGDQVIVNVQALDLELGSGGFDVVHVNLTKGLSGEGVPEAHVMKLNYTSLQHAVAPIEELVRRSPVASAKVSLDAPVAVLALHGQLAPLAWAFAKTGAGAKLGFVQTPGGALSGGHSRVVRTLRERGLLAGHITAGAAFGGEREAITTAGALQGGALALGWDAIVCGPGPGIVGSASTFGHGGVFALDSAHTALALGAPTLLVARMSSKDPRDRHRGISHHTRTVLAHLLRPVSVALPMNIPGAQSTDDAERHDWRAVEVDLESFRASGLPARTMGRSLDEDPLFFGSALAAGTVLAELLTKRDADLGPTG